MFVSSYSTSNAYEVNPISDFAYGESCTYEINNEEGHYLYKLSVSKDKESFDFVITNLNTNEITKTEYNSGIVTTYASDDNNEMKQISEIEVEEKDLDDRSIQSYYSRTECIIPTLAGNNLWYQLGSGSDAGYMKMGCDASYRVKANACLECSTFRSKIIEANNHFAKCGLSWGAAVAAIIAVLVAGGVGGITICAIYGIEGTCAYELIDACSAEEAAHDAYDIAKQYGYRS